VSPETIPEPDSCGANVAAYALGALDPAEAEAFARHMETCAVCPEELAAFQQVVDDIAISAPSVQAPAKLRRRVMRAVHDEPRANPRSARAPNGAGGLPCAAHPSPSAAGSRSRLPRSSSSSSRCPGARPIARCRPR
jgi:anti-sigma factor RsiW